MNIVKRLGITNKCNTISIMYKDDFIYSRQIQYSVVKND